MAELAKARSMQHYNIIQDYIAARCEKLAQCFYTAATWPGIEPSIYDNDTLVRRSTSKPPSHRTHSSETETLSFVLTAARHWTRSPLLPMIRVHHSIKQFDNDVNKTDQTCADFLLPFGFWQTGKVLKLKYIYSS